VFLSGRGVSVGPRCFCRAEIIDSLQILFESLSQLDFLLCSAWGAFQKHGLSATSARKSMFFLAQHYSKQTSHLKHIDYFAGYAGSL